jgi:hypothetical protein
MENRTLAAQTPLEMTAKEGQKRKVREKGQREAERGAKISGLCGHGAQKSCAPTTGRKTQEHSQE